VYLCCCIVSAGPGSRSTTSYPPSAKDRSLLHLRSIDQHLVVCHNMADRYRPSEPSRRESFQRKGISPPPRGSGTRLFTSQRKSRPNHGRNTNRAPGAIQKKGNSARQMQTRSKTRLVEKFSAMDIDQLDAQLNMLTAPLEDHPSMKSEQSEAMDLDLPAALRAPFKHHIMDELCPYSFCPVNVPVSHIC